MTNKTKAILCFIGAWASLMVMSAIVAVGVTSPSVPGMFIFLAATFTFTPISAALLLQGFCFMERRP
jgi:hypothetical protein